MKDNSLLLNSDIDSEFLILISKENQSVTVEGKNSTHNNQSDNERCVNCCF